MRRIATWLLLATAGTACKARPPSPAEVADRGWQAHELVVAAAEREPTCALAGAAMQRVFAAHRQAFVEAIALDGDRQRFSEAADYMEAQKDRYADLETRMIALSERCADDPAVQAAFAAMESP